MVLGDVTNTLQSGERTQNKLPVRVARAALKPGPMPKGAEARRLFARLSEGEKAEWAEARAEVERRTEALLEELRPWRAQVKEFGSEEWGKLPSGSQDQIQVSHGLTISEQLNTGFHSRILENARRTVPENSTEPPTILRTPYRRTMKRPAAAAEAAVRPKKPKAAAEHDEEAPEFWDYETNPPGTPGTNHRNDAELAQGRLPPPRVPGAGSMWLGGYGNSATDRTKHKAKEVTKGVAAGEQMFKACPGNIQCVILSKGVFAKPGEKVTIDVTLTTQLKHCDFYVGLLGHHGLGTYDGEVHFALCGGSGRSGVCQKFKDAEFGSKHGGSFPAIECGDVVRMSLFIDETEDVLQYWINDEEVTEQDIVQTVSQIRSKATRSGPWRGWRLFIGLTGATCSVKVL
ncbi:unnamed protein product [Durusdinium trenchii]|uniref:Galectin n=2 Tax=Durusdinium trenchii TaxID=1381693 RepID=A0ABP0QIB1_9DINO